MLKFNLSQGELKAPLYCRKSTWNRKGGRSEKRFARRTEEQKRNFLRRVSNRIEEEFENYTLDYIFLGGNRLIRAPLLRECKYLQ